MENQSFKGIGIFVLLLVIGVGVAAYFVTRPPDSDLDATEQAWVEDFRAWRDATEAKVDAARVRMSFESNRKNARLIEPLRTCSASLLRIGQPSELLADAQEAAMAACGRAEHAVAVNAEFGVDSLATTKLHLNEAGDRLRLARRNLRRALGEDEGA